MERLFTGRLAVALVASVLSVAAHAAPVRVVILTGANNHAWEKTTPVLKALLADKGGFAVEVVTSPELLTPAKLQGVDVLLSNWNAYGKNKPAPWSDALKQTYIDFVRNGGGHVVVHAGASSFYDWEEYHAIGLASWKGGQTGHKARHEFAMRVADPDHPAVAGVGDDLKTTDELWFRPGVHPDAKVVAEVFSKTTGNWEPSALVGQYGKGRCYCLLLGHGVANMKQPAFETLLLRGVEWTARRR